MKQSLFVHITLACTLFINCRLSNTSQKPNLNVLKDQGSSDGGAFSCQTPKKVLAFYYGWYAPDWGTLTVEDHPLEGTYWSQEDTTLNKHVDLAKANGIDGFVVSWFGHHEDAANNSLNVVLEKLLKIASEKNFCIAVDFEVAEIQKRGAQYREQLKYLLSTFGNHPNFLKIENKPVVLFWKNETLSDSTWIDIFNDPDIKRKGYFVSEAGGKKEGFQTYSGGKPVAKNIFDNSHYYSTWWNGAVNQQAYMWSLLSGKPKFGTVAPGFKKIEPGADPGRWANNGSGGTSMYENQWDFAIKYRPDYVLITSFNEWPEGHYIEPSQKFGFDYLNLTKKFAETFKGTPTTPVTHSDPGSTSPPTQGTITNSNTTPIPGPVTNTTTTTPTITTSATPPSQSDIDKACSGAGLDSAVSKASTFDFNLETRLRSQPKTSETALFKFKEKAVPVHKCYINNAENSFKVWLCITAKDPSTGNYTTAWATAGWKDYQAKILYQSCDEIP